MHAHVYVHTTVQALGCCGCDWRCRESDNYIMSGWKFVQDIVNGLRLSRVPSLASAVHNHKAV